MSIINVMYSSQPTNSRLLILAELVMVIPAVATIASWLPADALGIDRRDMRQHSDQVDDLQVGPAAFQDRLELFVAVSENHDIGSIDHFVDIRLEQGGHMRDMGGDVF